MIGWLLDLIPTWALVLAAVVAAVLVWRLLGLRGLLAASAAIITAGTYRAGLTPELGPRPSGRTKPTKRR